MPKTCLCNLFHKYVNRVLQNCLYVIHMYSYSYICHTILFICNHIIIYVNINMSLHMLSTQLTIYVIISISIIGNLLSLSFQTRITTSLTLPFHQNGLLLRRQRQLKLLRQFRNQDQLLLLR